MDNTRPGADEGKVKGILKRDGDEKSHEERFACYDTIR